MKVIAKMGDGKFLCEVGNTEVEKFLNLYYGKMDRLKIGAEVDLGRGHDFHSSILSAMNKTEGFMKGAGDIITAINNGLSVVSQSNE